MSRRPHWDDDLIEAVKDAISGWCFDHVEGPLYDEDVYPVIAAAEDWHKAKRDSRDRTHGTTSDGEPYCESCGVCDEGWRCRCCLAAEVEALRARNETLIATIQRQDSTFERQMEEHEELEALRAQVQRVRDAIEAELERHTLTNLGDFMFLDQALGRILNALDGDA